MNIFSYTNKIKSDGISYESFIGEFITTFDQIPYPNRYRDGILIKSMYPDKIPVIIDRGTIDTPKIKKNKFFK